MTWQGAWVLFGLHDKEIGSGEHQGLQRSFLLVVVVGDNLVQRHLAGQIGELVYPIIVLSDDSDLSSDSGRGESGKKARFRYLTKAAGPQETYLKSPVTMANLRGSDEGQPRVHFRGKLHQTSEYT